MSMGGGNVPEGYLLAAFVMAVGNQSDVIWVRRLNGRWEVVHDLLCGYPDKDAAGSRVVTQLREDYRKADALRAADGAADQMLKIRGGISMRVDLKSADRQKLHAKIARSPLAAIFQIASKGFREEVKAKARPEPEASEPSVKTKPQFVTKDGDPTTASGTVNHGKSRFAYFIFDPEDRKLIAPTLSDAARFPIGAETCSSLVKAVKNQAARRGADEASVRKILKGLDDFFESGKPGTTCRIALEGQLLGVVTSLAPS